MWKDRLQVPLCPHYGYPNPPGEPLPHQGVTGLDKRQVSGRASFGMTVAREPETVNGCRLEMTEGRAATALPAAFGVGAGRQCAVVDVT